MRSAVKTEKLKRSNVQIFIALSVRTCEALTLKKIKHDMQCGINVLLRRVRAQPLLQQKNNKYYILCVCVCVCVVFVTQHVMYIRRST